MGQYLYDYGPIEEYDDEEAQERRFPCTTFTLRWHGRWNYTIDILCGGTVLKPEVVTPWFTPAEYRAGKVPRDRDIIRDRTYDEITSGRLSASETGSSRSTRAQ